jgi:ribosomal protein S6
MWVRGFLSAWGNKKERKNARVLEDVTSFLSNSTGPSNSTQQWGLKSLEEKLVKDEITGYNEG